jgi:ATP-dependent Clp protease ATP-binding subunit ClpE
LEERVQAVVRELQEGGGKKVLVLEEVHRFAGSRSTGSADVLAMLLPGLRQGRFRLLGCTTHDQLRERLEKDQAALIEMLIRVPMPVVRGEEGCRLLSGLGQELAARHAVEVDAAVTKRAVALAEEQLPHCAMPGSARQLITGAAVTLWFETEMLRSDGERRSSRYWRHVGVPADSTVRPRLDERHLLYELAQNHGIPIGHLDSSVRRKIEGLRDSFARQIFGQDHVLEALDRAVKVALMNLADPRRPRGRLFFLGPPGTGKTECARILAQFLMGSEAALLRFDMSEFQDRSSVSSLLGSSRGLVDSEKGGRLTEPLRENPHRVILLDEIEKAHPDIFHLFLGILDNGECHDQQGGRVSFRHSILIFTSNAGSAGDGDLAQCDRAELVHRLRGTFSEAFLSRLESIVPFGPLTAEARRRVAAYQLGRVREQLLEVHGCELTWDDAVTAIVETPAAGEKGARDILHWIHTQVKPALVDALLDTGGRHVHLRVAGDGVSVSAERMDEPNGCSGGHPGGRTEAATGGTSTGLDEASSREVGAGAPRT